MRRTASQAAACLFLAAAFGCGPRHTELSQQESRLVADTGIPGDLALQLRNMGDELQRLTGVDALEESVPLPGVWSAVSARIADDMLENLRKSTPRGYYAFLAGLDMKLGRFNLPSMSRRLAIVRGMGPYDVVRAMGTNGANYQISNEMVIAKLHEWDDRYGVDIYSIDGDSVTFGLQREPGNVFKFAKEVYDFCPDTVNQGAETLDKLAADIRRTRGVSLWWD